jgi:UDP-N-acetylglucosamine--N-acetylmuramyl-(pentapeptide) pyrophosphoryl-undecaprenol N-acetylglucosamine transferase
VPTTHSQVSALDATITPARSGEPSAAPDQGSISAPAEARASTIPGPSSLPDPAPGAPRTLFVAATGGHLMQLTRLAPRIATLGRPLWVTFDSRQSRSLLAGEDVLFVPMTKPRDFRNVVGNLPHARRILDAHNIVEVVSTGSAVALSFLPLARLRGLPCHYIESAARSQGPSITGRALRHVRGTQLYTQYQQWSSPRWALAGSVFDEFSPSTPLDPVDMRNLRVLVTLGTLDYRFDRLVDAVRAAVRPGWEVLWQVGPNAYDLLPGRIVEMLDAAAFASACESSDVVIGHAGVGSALTALEAGRQPVLVPRRKEHGEHIDDHQRLIAHELRERDIAVYLEPDLISPAWFELAANRRVTRAVTPDPITLNR